LAASHELIFVDGTTFSGTELVARLLDAHPDLAAVSLPAPLHSDARGMPALLAGRIGLDDFGGDLGRRWPAGSDSAAGFRDSYGEDPLRACRELFWALVEDSGGEDAKQLVDASPGNLREAQTLALLFGEARFLHVVRDGRDVAAAACSAAGGARRMTAALARWAGELREIERGVRGEEDGTPYALPSGRFMVISLDDLTGAECDTARARLFEWLGLHDDEGTRSFAERELTPRAIGRGRWRERARGPVGWLLTRRYQRLLMELEREGNHAAPTLIHADEEAGRRE
jgi:Sulfotransferase family